jgi:hypothetical protein
LLNLCDLWQVLSYRHDNVHEPRAGTGDLSSSPPPKQVQPKAPRSAFMCFTDAKKKEILVSRTNTHKNKNILQIVAEAWRALTNGERACWDEEARNDKVRYVFILSKL